MMYKTRFKNYQSGATLAIALILLFVTTIVGVSTVQVANMQERMSHNTQDKMVAFEAAESALLAGEAWLLNLSQYPLPSSSCSPHPCVLLLDPSLNISIQTASWWQQNSASYSGSFSSISASPRYRIAFLRFVPDSPELGTNSPEGVYYYQVTAFATGHTTSAVSLLQTTVARRF